MDKRDLSDETIVRIRTWLFLGATVCGALMIGLSNAVWSSSCPNTDILGIFGYGCGSITGAQSEVVFGFGDGRAIAALGIAHLATCALALGFREKAVTLMGVATAIGLGAMAIASVAAFEYDVRGTLSQSLILLTAGTAAASIMSALFVWLEPRYEEELNGDTEAWA